MSGVLTGPGVDIYPLLSSVYFPIGAELWTISVALLGLSLVDKILGDDEDDSAAEDTAGEEASDDDIFTADDDLGELDEMDEWEDDDGFDDGESGQAAAELEPRIEELENEVAGISSTVSTVRSENEAISDSVEEVEENVRKLLDIYEMVTRGVNPFVDDTGGDAFENDSFGLFGGEEDEPAEKEPVDDEVMGADADSFFDDDFEGSDDFDDGDDLGADELDEGGLEDEEFDDDLDLDDTEDGGDDEDGAKTFDELKAEYESGDADWDDEIGDDTIVSDGPNDDESEEEAAAGDGLDDAGFENDEEGFEFDQVDDDTAHNSPDHALEEAASELTEDDADGDDGAEDTSEPNQGTTVENDAAEVHEVAANGSGAAGADGKKPYLTRIPDGYSSELIVMEWMDYLRRHADTAETLRAIDYYRNLDWISDHVATDLTEVVRGFQGNTNGSDSERSVSELTIDHHTNSLEYISQLDESTIDIDLITNWPARGE